MWFISRQSLIKVSKLPHVATFPQVATWMMIFFPPQQVGLLYKPKLCLYFKYLEFLSDPDAFFKNFFLKYTTVVQ